jgi:hypothetical protein
VNELIALREIGVGLAAFMVFSWVLLRIIREIKSRPEPAIPIADGNGGKAGNKDVNWWLREFDARFKVTDDLIAIKFSAMIDLMYHIEEGQRKVTDDRFNSMDKRLESIEKDLAILRSRQ